jgi:hypothetical protein
MDPSKKQRVGYLVDFTGLDMGEYLKKDIEVFTPWGTGADPKYGGLPLGGPAKDQFVVTGIIESMTYNGGVGDPICISAYISAQNAEIIKGKMKGTLKTTVVKKMSYFICNFDEENKAWFEEAYPIGGTGTPAGAAWMVSGQLNAPGGKDIRLQVADDPTKVASNVDVNVYSLYFEIVPAANSTYALHFATSQETKFVRNWGLKIGSLNSAAVDAAGG